MGQGLQGGTESCSKAGPKVPWVTITMSDRVSVEKTGWRRAKSNEHILVTWTDIGHFLGVGPRQAMRYYQFRGLPAVRIGKVVRAHRRILELWLLNQGGE